MAQPRSDESAIEDILERVRAARNVDFRNYKRATLRRRIERRMADRGCASFADYRALLDREPAEFDSLVTAMLIKVTTFFRDPDVWHNLERRVLPNLLAEKRPGEEIRIWSAGCATGEEAYSLAMVVSEVMGGSFGQHEVKIFATDADEKSIAFARQAVYPQNLVRDVPKPLLKKYFVADGAGFAVRKDLRRVVVFGVNNLVADVPISRLDLIVCRNVFIYLDAALQKRVLARFHYALRRQGILVLGRSELIPFAGKIFHPVDLKQRVYVKDGDRKGVAGDERLLSLLEQNRVSRGDTRAGQQVQPLEKFHSNVLQSIRLPLVVASLDGVVLLWNAAAERLWHRTEMEVVGKRFAALDLPAVPGDLLVEKTASVREGRTEVERSVGTLHNPGAPAPLHICIEVTALRDAKRETTGLLYVVHDVTTLRDAELELHAANQERHSALEEMQTVQEEMQSSNAELETTNEELQSANEELQTTNEELQSTNEELETTNEELQSTNAEMDATNRELAQRTEEMNIFAFVQRTIVRSLTAGVIVLDEAGRVKLWNLAAERLLGVTEDEATGQVLWTLYIPALSRALLQKVRKSQQQSISLRIEKLQYELPSGGKGVGSLASMPIIDGGKVLGSLILFDDVTRFSSVSAELATIKAGENGKARKP